MRPFTSVRADGSSGARSPSGVAHVRTRSLPWVQSWVQNEAQSTGWKGAVTRGGPNVRPPSGGGGSDTRCHCDSSGTRGTGPALEVSRAPSAFPLFRSGCGTAGQAGHRVRTSAMRPPQGVTPRGGGATRRPSPSPPPGVPAALCTLEGARGVAPHPSGRTGTDLWRVLQ